MDSDATLSSVDMPTGPGKIGHYEVLSKLGAGGMGIVYKARDTKLKRWVALKVLPSTMSGDAHARQRLLREARSAAQLDHPNICTVYSIDEYDGGLCIAMQFLEGRSLREELSSGPMPIDRFRNLALQLVDGLDEAHRKGIIHRDLKPANIMLLPGDRLKLVDFGLAASSMQGELSMTAGTGGTPAYMAPEVFRGQAADERSDLFATGVIFYEMLSGKSPFPRDSAAAVMEAIMHSNPPALQIGDPGLLRIVERLMAKDPAQRYATASDLRSELSGVPVPAAPPAARPPNLTERFHHVRSLLAVAAVVVLLSIWGFSAFKKSGAPAESAPATKSEPTPAVAAAAVAAAPAATKASVAALPFTNAQKDAKWSQFEQGIADSFADAFVRDARFRVVERSQLDKALAELKLNKTDAVAPETAQRVGKIIGARYLVVGSFQVFEGQMRLNARLIRVETGEIVQARTVTGAASDALKLSDSAAQEFLRAVKAE